MEITDEIKTRIFLPYWGQTFINGLNGHSTLSIVDINSISQGLIKATLLLRPAAALTESELLEISDIYPHNTPGNKSATKIQKISAAKKIVDHIINGVYYKGYPMLVDIMCVIQYLYSIGIALPYMEHEIQELVEAGIYLLKEETTQKSA